MDIRSTRGSCHVCLCFLPSPPTEMTSNATKNPCPPTHTSSPSSTVPLLSLVSTGYSYMKPILLRSRATPSSSPTIRMWRVPSHLRETQYLPGQPTHCASISETTALDGTGSLDIEVNILRPVVRSVSWRVESTRLLLVTSLVDTTGWMQVNASFFGGGMLICLWSSYPSFARIGSSRLLLTSIMMPMEEKNSMSRPTFRSHLSWRSKTRRLMSRCSAMRWLILAPSLKIPPTVALET